jgi:hypothetical protein
MMVGCRSPLVARLGRLLVGGRSLERGDLWGATFLRSDVLAPVRCRHAALRARVRSVRFSSVYSPDYARLLRGAGLALSSRRCGRTRGKPQFGSWTIGSAISSSSSSAHAGTGVRSIQKCWRSWLASRPIRSSMPSFPECVACNASRRARSGMWSVHLRTGADRCTSTVS